MNNYSEKSQSHQSQSMANPTSERQVNNETTFQFLDNRPEAVAQRRLQEMADNSAQAKNAAQFKEMAAHYSVQQKPIQKQENNTGLPDNLKEGIENLSGYPMNDVKVQYNSDKPAQLQAHAYTQGTDIHIAPGQGKHLPHEAWHVVQQKQGRVKPYLQMKDSVNVNDDAGLEKKEDVMGTKALQIKPKENKNRPVANSGGQKKSNVKQVFGFVDNRPDRAIQRQLSEIATEQAQYNVAQRVKDLTIGAGGICGPAALLPILNDLGCNIPDVDTLKTQLINQPGGSVVGEIFNQSELTHIVNHYGKQVTYHGFKTEDDLWNALNATGSNGVMVAISNVNFDNLGRPMDTQLVNDLNEWVRAHWIMITSIREDNGTRKITYTEGQNRVKREVVLNSLYVANANLKDPNSNNSLFYPEDPNTDAEWDWEVWSRAYNRDPNTDPSVIAARNKRMIPHGTVREQLQLSGYIAEIH